MKVIEQFQSELHVIDLIEIRLEDSSLFGFYFMYGGYVSMKGYQSTRRNVPKDFSIQQHRCQNPKFCLHRIVLKMKHSCE